MSDYRRELDAILRGEGVSLANPGLAVDGQSNPIMSRLGGAARGLASFLEPIQLPQDVLFGAVAGALDPETTIAGRLRTVDVGAYLPWGRAPDRPATGQEIFELAGLEGRSAKWAGIGADLFADPLLFGSYLRVGGKLLKSDDLLNLGDKFDDMLSPMGLASGTKGVIARAAPEFNALIDRRIEEMIQVVRNPESSFMGIDGFGGRFQGVFDKIAPRQSQLNLKFGKETGGELGKIERMAKVAGQRLSEDNLNLLAQAQSGMLGERGKEFVEGYVGILGRYRQAHERHLTDVTQLVRDTTERQVYEVSGKRGLLFSEVSEETSDPSTVDLFNEVRKAAFGERGAARREAPDPIRELVLTGRAKVRAAAVEAGEDANVAVQRFNDYLQEITEIDAALGKHVSGFDFVKGVAFERVQALTGSMDEAQSFWMGLVGAGVNNRFDAHLKSETKWKPADILKASPERVAAVQARRGAYKQQLLEEMELSGLSDDAIDLATTEKRMSEIERGVLDLYEESAQIKQQLKGRGDWGRYEQAVDDYANAVENNARAVVELRQQSRQWGGRKQQRANPMGEPDSRRGFSDPLQMGRAVQRLRQVTASRLKAEAAVEEAMSALTSNERVARNLRRDLGEEALEGMRQMEKLRRDFNTRRFKYTVDPETAAKARAKAAEAADSTPLPALEKDLNIEELVVERMARGATYDDALNKPFTVEEIIDSAQAFSHLDLGAYLRGLADGHLRRSYGLFQDRNGFRRYTSAVRNGRLLMNNVLDETNLDEAMAGFEMEADLIRQYQRHLDSGPERKAVIAQGALVQHMIENGVQPGRARDAMTALVKGLHSNNPAMTRQIELLEEMVPRYESFFDANRKGGGRSFYGPKEPDIPRPILETLGEFSRASASVSESAEGARRVMGKQQFFQNTWKLAKAKGLVRNEKYVDDMGTTYIKVDDTGGMFKAFSGRYVHPQLLREMEKTLKVDDTYSGWQRMRALLTGGYLASPNVLAANFFGGFYQSATAGIGPHRMAPRIARVWERVRRVQDGETDEIIERLRAHVPLEISTLSYHALQKDFQRMRLDHMGIGPEGVRKTLQQMEDAYISFLNRPGIGPLRTRYAGLDGFQMIENVFKVAAFEEMLEELPKRWARKGVQFTDEMVEQHAAEFARTVVFDYSELPSGLDALKNTGLVLFPGFAYFLAGRTLETYWKRPGVLGVSDRMSEAVANMQLSEDEQLKLWLGMPDWLKQDQGVPLTVREGEPGDTRASVIPLAQLIPTQTIWDAPMGQGNPWAESLSSAGLWGPFAEVLYSLVHGEGEAFISARYGNRVFDPDAEGATRAAQTGRFLYNTLAPGAVRKLVRPSYEGGAEGVIPEMVNYAFPPAMTEALYSFEELRARRPERDFKDEVLGVMLRSPQPIAIDGEIPGVARELRSARSSFQNEISSLRTKYGRAQSKGNTARMESIEREIVERTNEFNELWSTYMNVYQRGSDRAR